MLSLFNKRNFNNFFEDFGMESMFDEEFDFPLRKINRTRRHNLFDDFFNNREFNFQQSTDDEEQEMEVEEQKKCQCNCQEKQEEKHKKSIEKNYFSKVKKVHQFIDENGEMVTDIFQETDKNGEKHAKKQKLVHDKNRQLISEQKWYDDEIAKLEQENVQEKPKELEQNKAQ